MTNFRNLFGAAAIAVAATVALAAAATAGPYSVRWTSGATNFDVEINPIVYDNGGGNFRTAAQYYSYNSPFGASANTPDNLERSNTATMFLYDDPNNGLSLFHIYDRFLDPDGSEIDVSINSAGLAGTGQSFLVRDDPGDTSFAWNDPTGSAILSFRSSACCTDGWVLGLLPDHSTDSWSIDVDFTFLDGINTFEIVTLQNPFTTQATRTIQRFAIDPNGINTLEFVRTGETVTAVTAPAGLIFPLAALGLIAVRRRNKGGTQ